MIYALAFVGRTFDDGFMTFDQEDEEDGEQFLYSLLSGRDLLYVGVSDSSVKRSAGS